MSEGKSSISNASSYQEMGEFWDTHDAGEFWDQTKPAELEVDLQHERVYFPVGRTLSAELSEIAREEGVSAVTLLNLWIQERILKLRQNPV
jgi:hypothetical protein